MSWRKTNTSAHGRVLLVLQTTFAAMLAAGCGATRERALTITDMNEAENSIAAVLDDWHDDASSSDEASYFDHFTPGAVFLGTDATERWDVAAFREYAHPHFARGQAWSFHAIRRAVILSADGETAWFDEDLETENLGPARGSGVMVRGEDGSWRIAHYNLSITIPNERFHDVRSVLEADPETRE